MGLGWVKGDWATEKGVEVLLPGPSTSLTVILAETVYRQVTAGTSETTASGDSPALERLWYNHRFESF